VVLAAAGAATALIFGALVVKLPFGPPLVVMGLGGMTLVLAGMALLRVVQPLLGDGLAPAAAPQAPVRRRELERDKQAVLKAIREIELDYQMRKIAEVDYRDLVQRYRARAMRIIRELDAGDDYRTLIEEELKTRLAAATTTGCRDCGLVNDPDARFCKKCGVSLLPPKEPQVAVATGEDQADPGKGAEKRS
jgi:ribosomal protein L40E